MYTLNIAKAIKKMSVNEITDFIFENYYKRIRFFKENKFFFNETLEKKRFIVTCEQINRKIPDPCNAQQHYESFLRKKNRKSVIIRNNYLSTKKF